MFQQRLFFGNGGTKFSKNDAAVRSQRPFEHLPYLQMLKRDAARTVVKFSLNSTTISLSYDNFTHFLGISGMNLFVSNRK